MRVGIVDLLIVIIYIAFVLWYGLYKGKKVKDYEDYVVGGRQFSAFVLVGTLIMTELNTASLVGLSSQGYVGGIMGLWFAITFAASLGIYTIFFAKKWKRFNGVSLIEMYDERFGKSLGNLAAVMMALAMIGLTAVYLTSASKVFGTAFGWSYLTTILVITVTVLILTLTGGLVSVVYTDMAAFLITIVGIPVIFITAAAKSGGFTQLSTVFDSSLLTLKPQIDNPVLPASSLFGFMLLSICMYQMSPWYAQRMFSAKDEKAATKAMSWSTVGVVVLYALLILTAAFSRIQWPNLEDPDMGLINAILDWTPTIIKGFMLAVVYSVAQSTMSSIWNTNAALITQTMYKGWVNKEASEEKMFSVSKNITFILAVITIIISYFFVTYVLRALVFADIFLMVLIFATIAAFYWWDAGKWSAMLSTIAGLISAATLTFSGVGEFIMILKTIPIILIVGIVVGLLEPKPTGENLKKRVEFYDKVGAPAFGKKKYLEAKKLVESGAYK